MSTKSSDNIANRRRSQDKVRKDANKRVSFEDNTLTDIKFLELKAFHSDNDIRNDKLDTELLKKCIETKNFDSAKKGINNVQLTGKFHMMKNISKNVESLLLSERGSPEGQEDPGRYSSSSSLTENTKDVSKFNGEDLLIRFCKHTFLIITSS